MVQIDVENKKDVFVLELNEPVVRGEWDRFFELLAGDKDFWPDYVKRHIKHPGDNFTGNDFDLFHNAVVTLLQTKYRLPIDMVIYSKDMISHIMFSRIHDIYNWIIFLDRSLLAGAEVPAIFNNLVSGNLPSESKNDGLDESTLVPYSPFTFELFRAHPDLNQVMERPIGDSNDPVISPLILRDGYPFWTSVYFKFKPQMYGPNSPLMKGVDSLIQKKGYIVSEIQNYVRTEFISCWNQVKKDPTANCSL